MDKKARKTVIKKDKIKPMLKERTRRGELFRSDGCSRLRGEGEG